ncbi:MAG TPA: CRISPR-associated helicase Cas3' [Alicyclobacillus sp.]|nr:CRISPR-associated helicase Cas3' [Alicyclobacillus sp.]
MAQGEYYAHYDREKGIAQPLVEHLYHVAAAARDAVPPVVLFPAVPNGTVREIAWWTGYFHDFGKYTRFFQDYLVKGISSPLKQHAHISAMYVHGRVLDLLTGDARDPQRSAIAFLTYLVVRFHHRSLALEGLFPEVPGKSPWPLLAKLADHLGNNAEQVLLNSRLADVLSPKDFRRIGDPESRHRDKKNFLYAPKYFKGRWKDVQWYFLLLYLFSLLIDVDKLDSAGVESRSVTPLSHSRVPAYLARKHPGAQRTPLRIRREQARHSMLARLDALSDEEIRNVRFFTITAPTGIGKTLAALECALRLQGRIWEVEGHTPRIVTAIPFINIIEQTRRDYEKVLAEGDDQTGRLVVHHSLADLSRTAEEESNEELPLDRLLLEVESWEGDIILTTFVQLFHSMFTGANRSLKKIHKMAGAIVLLDEVQAVPDKYQPLIGALLRKMGEFYGTRFVLMTATQPRILEFGDQLLQLSRSTVQRFGDPPVELLQDYPRYFSEQRRTKLVPMLIEPLGTEAFVSMVARLRGTGQSVLVVVNTIRRSIEVFRAMKERMSTEIDCPKVLYLSTNIIPRQRRRVIRLARRLLRLGYPVVMVSTQTIEAGVDLDFDIGFRDLAPLESIIQTAGRVNREGKKGEYAPVYVVRLEDDGQKVYAFHHMHRTQSLLEKHEEILEPEYGRLVQEYYNRLLEDGVSEESRNIWEEGVLKLDFQVVQQFQLISNAGDTIEVYVETVSPTDRGSFATRLADAYEMIIRDPERWDWSKLEGIVDSSFLSGLGERPDPFRRKAILRVIRAKMSDYVIQVKRHRAAKNLPMEFFARGGVRSDLFWVPPGNFEELYDPETGFRENSGVLYLY